MLSVEHVFPMVGCMAAAPTISFNPATTVGDRLCEAFATTRSGLDSLASTDLHALTVDEIAGAVIEFQQLVDHATAVLATYVSAADAALVWSGTGHKNITGWLAEHSKLGYRHAAELTRLADVLDSNDLIAQKVASGDMSTATATILASTVLAPPLSVTSADVAVLVEACTNSDPVEARTAAETWKAIHDPVDDVTQAERRFARRAVRFSRPIDGMTGFTGLLPVLQADQVRKMLTAHGGGRPQPNDTRTPEQRMADGLIALAGHTKPSPSSDGASDGTPRGPSGRQSARLLVTVPITTLTDPNQPEAPEDPHGPEDTEGSSGRSSGSVVIGGWTEYDNPLPPSVVLQLASTVSPTAITRIAHDGPVVTSVDGISTLDYERTLRTCTPSQYLALLVRDGHCRWPGCFMPPAWCHADHLHPWEHGGPTNLDNLWLLCSHHHTQKHRAGTTCTTTSDGTGTGTSTGARGGTNNTVTINLPNGTTLTSAPTGPITRTTTPSLTTAPTTTATTPASDEPRPPPDEPPSLK